MPKGRPCSWTPEQDDLLRFLLVEKQFGPKQAAQYIYGKTSDQIINRRKHLKIPGKPYVMSKPMSQAEVRTLDRMWRDGVPRREIAEHFGMSVAQIQRRRVYHLMPTRRPRRGHNGRLAIYVTDELAAKIRQRSADLKMSISTYLYTVIEREFTQPETRAKTPVLTNGRNVHAEIQRPSAAGPA